MWVLPELVPGNSLSQQKGLWEVQSSCGINLALQKYLIMMFSLVGRSGGCWMVLCSQRCFQGPHSREDSGPGQEEMLLLLSTKPFPVSVHGMCPLLLAS